MDVALPGPAALLAEDRFVRSVAWSLLHDPDLAADAAQETWLATIRAQPEARGGLRGWLTTVARNAARLGRRGDARRAGRERAAARPEGVPSVAEVVEREETRRRVVDAVLSLEPAARDVVLLRFFEDLPPREVARRLGVPVDTVRSRTRRALETLRARLDQEHGGDRRRWILALLPLARRPSGAAVAAGAGAAVAWKASLVAGVVAVGGYALWRAARPADDAPAPPQEVASGSEAGNASLAGAPRPAVAAPPPAAAPESPKPAAESPRVRGRVVDAAGNAVGHAAVWIDVAFPGHGSVRAVSAGDGSYELPAAAGPHVVMARAPHTATSRAEVTLAAGASEAAVPDLVLTEGATIRGRVLDANGRPAATVRVKGFATGGTTEVIDTVFEGKALHFAMDDVVTDADGNFVLSGLEAGVPHKVWLETYMTPDFKGEPEQVTGAMPGGPPLEFRYVPRNALRGIVLDARTKEPLPRFWVNGLLVRSDEGRFTVPAGVGGKVVVRARGYLEEAQDNPASQEGDRAPTLVFRMALDPDAGTLAFAVRDEAGNPVRDFHVQASGPGFSVDDDDLSATGGEARLSGLAAGEYRGHVTAPGYGLADLTATVPKAGEARVEVVLARSSPVHLRVLDARGNVARWAKVSIADAKGAGPTWRFRFDRMQGTAFGLTDMTWYAATPPAEANLSEAEGRIEGLPAGRYVLHAAQDGVAKDVPFEVVAGKETTLEVKLSR
jgi:RNA polymerase sigma-70 factor (ECF subfamily)